MKMTGRICIDGQEGVLKAHSATESLKEEFKQIIPNLPDNWRDTMKAYNPYYKTDKGNGRLSNIRNGRVAPTLTEINQLKKIAGL